MDKEERISELLQSIVSDVEYGEVLYNEEMFKEFKDNVGELYGLIKDMKDLSFD